MSRFKIISGGQTGVDIAALKVAKLAGFDVGGWMPKGWKTLDGPRPEYEKRYGMQEGLKPGYPWRTGANVKAADFTLQLFEIPRSPGEVCTRNWIRKLRKPSFELDLRGESLYSPHEVATAILTSNTRILNIAGNSNKTCPGIELRAIRFLMQVLPLLAR